MYFVPPTVTPLAWRPLALLKPLMIVLISATVTYTIQPANSSQTE